jgi:FkbM family methyltransferase
MRGRSLGAPATGGACLPNPPGCDSERLALNSAYDAQTIAVMERTLQRNSCCVDVGCHVGSILQEMRRLAPNGIHWAFEPLPVAYREVVKAFPEVHVSPIALSDKRGTSSFQHVVSNPGYSGLLQRKYPGSREEVEVITVETDLLDNMLPADLPVRLIKIDVEGAELQVLRGAMRTIRTHRPIIIFEHGLGAADYYNTHPEDVYDFLVEQCGLRISLMARWLVGEPALSRDAFVQKFENGDEFYFIAYP